MQEYFIEVRRTLVRLVLWGIAASLAMCAAGYGGFVPGFAVGVTASIVYYILMCYRVRKCAELPVPKAVAYMRAGWLVRLCFIVLVLALSVRLPGVNFWASVAGLFSLHAVMVINAAVLIIKGVLKMAESKQSGKG